MNRKHDFAALLAVIGVSITFGMILGGKLNAPQVMLAAQDASFLASPAASVQASGVPPSFADIADAAIPAVVSIVSTSVQRVSGDDDPHNPFRNDPFFRRFFNPPDRDDRTEAPEERRVSGGSGFILSPDGYIMTNYHVVENAKRLVVTLNSAEKYDARVVGTDPSIDMALIKIDPKSNNLPTLPLGDSDKLRVGEWVIAIGNPLSLEHTVTVGVVSAKGRQVPVGSSDIGLTNYIQTDAAINFGNSGGPLLDSRGNVVGINSAILRGGTFSDRMVEGIGFALPITQARRSAEQIRTSGSVQRGYLGITMDTKGISEDARDYYKLPDSNGVIVESVAPKGPADKAGVKEGDIIRKFEGDTVKDSQDLLNKVASRQPGENVRIELLRGGKAIASTVALATRPRQGGAGEEEANPPEEEGEAADEAQGLGIKVEGITARMRELMGRAGEDIEGVIVSHVEPDSRAADEGIQPSMIITGVNDHPVRGIADWKEAVRKLDPGDPVKLRARYGSRTRNFFLRVPNK